MQVDNIQLINDTHTGNTTGFAMIPVMCRHHAGWPTGQPTMTRISKIGIMNYMYKCFDYYHPVNIG